MNGRTCENCVHFRLSITSIKKIGFRLGRCTVEVELPDAYHFKQKSYPIIFEHMGKTCNFWTNKQT